MLAGLACTLVAIPFMVVGSAWSWNKKRVLLAATVATLLLAAAILAAPDRSQRDDWSERNARRAALWSCIICGVMFCLGVVLSVLASYADGGLNDRLVAALDVQRLLAPLVILCQSGTLLIYLGKLALRFPDERLGLAMSQTGQTLLLGAAVMLAAGVGLILLVALGRSDEPLTPILRVGMDLLAFGGMAGIMIAVAGIGMSLRAPWWLIRCHRWLVRAERAIATERQGAKVVF